MVKKTKKGFEPISALIIGLIVTLTLSSWLVPKVFLIGHVVKVVEYEYDYDNAQLSLLILLSDKSVYKDLSYFVAGMGNNDKCPISNLLCYSRDSAKAAIEGRLDKVVPSKCYKLSFRAGDTETVIVDKNCNPTTIAKAIVVLPSRLVGEIKLVMK